MSSGDTMAGQAAQTMTQYVAKRAGLSAPTGDARLQTVVYASAFTAVSEVLVLAWPALNGAVALNGTGFTLAQILARLEEVEEMVNRMVAAPEQAAATHLRDAVRSVQAGNYPDAFSKLKEVDNKATEGFHLAEKAENLAACTRMRMIARILVLSYSRKEETFRPVSHLDPAARNNAADQVHDAFQALLRRLYESASGSSAVRRLVRSGSKKIRDIGPTSASQARSAEALAPVLQLALPFLLHRMSRAFSGGRDEYRASAEVRRMWEGGQVEAVYAVAEYEAAYGNICGEEAVESEDVATDPLRIAEAGCTLTVAGKKKMKKKKGVGVVLGYNARGYHIGYVEYGGEGEDGGVDLYHLYVQKRGGT